jgi:hypothetical protein
LIPCAPALSRAGERVLSFLQYHEARGIEVGTTWASMALILNLIGWVPAHAAHDFGAFHIKGDAATVFTHISSYVMVAAALAPQLVAFMAGGLGRSEDALGKVGLRTTCAATLGFMIGGKVLSPQFAVWLAPLLAVAATEPLAAIAALASAALTTVEYPFTAAALEMLAPGHAWAVTYIATRNVLFIALYAWLTHWLWTGSRSNKPRLPWGKRRAPSQPSGAAGGSDAVDLPAIVSPEGSAALNDGRDRAVLGEVHVKPHAALGEIVET